MKEDVIIREAQASDAEQMIQHTKIVLGENPDIMATAMEEFRVTPEAERRWIEERSRDGFFAVAELNQAIVGLLTFQLSPRKKFRHQGSFGMSIQEAYTNRGIGSALINAMFDWIQKDGRTEKICLEVFSNNERAIHVYKKHGFHEEGRRIKQVKLAPDRYTDEIIMSRFM